MHTLALRRRPRLTPSEAAEQCVVSKGNVRSGAFPMVAKPTLRNELRAGPYGTIPATRH